MATTDEEKKRKEMTYGEQMSALGTALANIPKHIVSAPGYGLDSPAFQSKPKPAAAPAVAPPSTPGPSIDRVAPAAAPATPGYDYNGGPATMPPAEAGSGNLGGLDGFRTGGGDITKTVDANGRTSYSGTNIGAGATINGREAGGGYMEVPSGARGLAGFAAPAEPPSAAAAPVIRHSGNDWQARTDLRNAQTAASTLRGDWDRFRDGEIDNFGRPTGKGGSAAQAAYQAQLGADLAARSTSNQLPAETMRANAGLQREALQQSGENQRSAARLGLEAFKAQDARATSALERQRTGLAMEGEQQMAGLRQTLLSADSTPEQKKQAQASLLALQGKQEQANRFTVVPGGQHIDQASGRAYTVPSQVLNNQTGQWMQPPGQTQTAQATPQDRPVGTTSTVNGKTAVWDGNKWVPT